MLDGLLDQVDDTIVRDRRLLCESNRRPSNLDGFEKGYLVCWGHCWRNGCEEEEVGVSKDVFVLKWTILEPFI